MRLRTTPAGLIAHDELRERWVALPGERDLLKFLAQGASARERAEAALAADDAVSAPWSSPSRSPTRWAATW